MAFMVALVVILYRLEALPFAVHTMNQARVGQPHDTYGFNLFGHPRSFYCNPSQGHNWLYYGRDFF
jgi:hypothetical protein